MTDAQLFGLFLLIIGQKYAILDKLEKNISDIIIYGICTIGGGILLLWGN